LESFVKSYLANRHQLEAGYHRLGGGELAALARRQGAAYVIAGPGQVGERGPLERLRTEGEYAVFRVVEAGEEIAAGSGKERE
jgi:hypothetical protein